MSCQIQSLGGVKVVRHLLPLDESGQLIGGNYSKSQTIVKEKWKLMKTLLLISGIAGHCLEFKTCVTIYSLG